MQIFELLGFLPDRALLSHLSRELCHLRLSRHHPGETNKDKSDGLRPARSHSCTATDRSNARVQATRTANGATLGQTGSFPMESSSLGELINQTYLEAFVFRRGLACNLVRTLQRLLCSCSVFLQHSCCLGARCRRCSLCLLRTLKV